MSGRALVGVVVSAFAVATLDAHVAESGWIELTSSTTNTRVVSNAGEPAARQLLASLDTIHDLFARALGDGIRDDGEPLIVVAPRDTNGMRELVGDGAKRNRGLLVAASLPSPYSHHLAVNLDARQARNGQLLRHEYLHQVTRVNVPDPKGWLDEGLSEFWSTLVTDGNDARVGAEIGHHMRALRSQPWIPLATLVAIKPGEYDEVKGRLGLFYAESWLLVHYLTVAEPRRAISYEPQLPADLSALERRLKSYVASALPTLPIRLKGASGPPPTVSVRPLSSSESLSVRASAILYSDRRSAAVSLAERALSLDASQALALEVKGISYFLGNQPLDAKKWLQLAVAQPSASFRAHYYYGVVSSDTPELAREHLMRALELKPGFEPARQRLQKPPALFHIAACACC